MIEQFTQVIPFLILISVYSTKLNDDGEGENDSSDDTFFWGVFGILIHLLSLLLSLRHIYVS